MKPNELHPYVQEHVFRRDGDRWGFEFRPHLLDTNFMSGIARAYWQKPPYEGPHQVCGIEFGGVPLAYAISSDQNDWGSSRALAFRKEKKSFANKSLVEGLVGAGPVVLVDDILSSGGSFANALAELKALRINVVGVFCIVDFGREDIDERLTGLFRKSLFSIQDFGIETYQWKS